MLADTFARKCRFLIVLVLLAALAMNARALMQTDIVYSMEDTYVNNTAPDNNYDAQTLVSGKEGSDEYEIWLKPNLSAPSGYYVTGASIWLYSYDIRNSKTFNAYTISDTTWTETNLTWNNKPDYITIESQRVVSSTGWWNWTVTPSYSTAFSSGDSYITYAIAAEIATAVFYAEDTENTFSTGNLPYLNLTMMIPEAFHESPADSYSTYDTDVLFQYNTTDAGSILNCSLLFDGIVNRSNTSLPANTTSTFTLTDIYPGDHTWAVRCYDGGRYVYEMNTGARDITILASVEWYNPSSASPLDIGSVLMNGPDPSGSREVYANNTNTNVQVSCASGDCSVITTNWSTQDMSGGQTLSAHFNCSTSVAGTFQADFQAVSDQDAVSDTLTVNCSILAPDLRINSTNITFSDNSPTEDQTVTITAGVYNEGTYDATDAIVSFYEGHYSTGTQIGGNQTITLAPGSHTTVQQNWTARIGTYEIHVVVDPPVDTNGTIEESDESDNHAYNTIDISMWTVFVGNVTGSLALQTEDNKTLLRWNVTDTTDSLLYVTDTDSNPSFIDLVAFSRNTTGGYMNDDFIEFDSALNTTLYPDSANLTFTSGGSPLTTGTFTVFGTAIPDVPVIDSTNSSTFRTGILWDSSDDSNNNNQFDNETDEDVIFVTMVNQTKQGLYGIYDYEIKVPARLKNFKGPDVQTVTFYAEIK